MHSFRIAIIGFGRSAEISHAPVLKHHKGFEWVAAVDVSGERRSAAERFGVRAYADYLEMVEREKPELVLILTRNDQHAAMAIECLRRKCHVMVTKPISLNADEAVRVMHVALGSGRMVLPWMPMRMSPVVDRIRQIIESSLIGDCYFLRHSASIFGVRNDWQTIKRYGGGYLLNFGPHLIDPVLNLVGVPVKRVYGNTAQVANPGDADDVFSAQLEFANGIRAQCEFNLNAFNGPPSWLILGTRGSIKVEKDQLILRHTDCLDVGVQPDINEVSEEVGMIREGLTDILYNELFGQLNGTASPVYDWKSAIELMKIIDAVRNGSNTGNVIEIE